MFDVARNSTALVAALQADHERLDVSLRHALAALRGGETDLIRAAWLRMEAELGAHMKAEEEFILPLFQRSFPHEAARVRREHSEIRRWLELLGVELDLHCLRAATADAFVSALRDHARHEESSFYQWAERELSESDKRSLVERLLAVRRCTESTNLGAAKL